MLVLRRKKDEAVIITAGGQKIELVVTATEKGACKIGIAASAEVNIRRAELEPADCSR